jgi:hypothetical protein
MRWQYRFMRRVAAVSALSFARSRPRFNSRYKRSVKPFIATPADWAMTFGMWHALDAI